MLFNFGKCNCLHTGPGNTGMNYETEGTILSKTVKEKDLGVTMNAKVCYIVLCFIMMYLLFCMLLLEINYYYYYY